MKIKIWFIPVLFLIVTILFYFLINFSAIKMGLSYLLSNNIESKTSDLGEFEVINDLVKLTNFQRFEYIKEYLEETKIKYTVIPVTSEGGNIFISSDVQSVKKVLFVAHYDTYLNTAGALDNASSIGVLLKSLDDLINEIDSGKVSILFTAGEERGLLGSKVFVNEYMKVNNLNYNLIVNLDCVGSGNPIIVSSSDKAGLVVNFFPFGKFLYDGNNFARLGKYWGLNKKNFDHDRFELKYIPSIIGYSDTFAFLTNNMNAFHITTDNMKSITDYTHRPTDTVYLLRNKYLTKTKKAIVAIAKEY